MWCVSLLTSPQGIIASFMTLYCCFIGGDGCWLLLAAASLLCLPACYLLPAPRLRASSSTQSWLILRRPGPSARPPSSCLDEDRAARRTTSGGKEIAKKKKQWRRRPLLLVRRTATTVGAGTYCSTSGTARPRGRLLWYARSHDCCYYYSQYSARANDCTTTSTTTAIYYAT